MFDKTKRFLLEVHAEFKKVNWPSRVETIALTVLVLFLLVALTVYVGLWDLIFQSLIKFVLNR